MPTDAMERKIRKTYIDMELTTAWAADEDIIDIDVETGVAITGTCRMIKLRYNNLVDGTGVMTGIELVARAGAKIGYLQAMSINVLSKGKDISGAMRGIELVMEEDQGGATIAALYGILVDVRLKSIPTASAAILLQSSDTYPPKYGIDMKGTLPLGPSMADIRLSNGPCIFSQAGVPTRTDLPVGSICLNSAATTKDTVLYVFYPTAWSPLTG